MAIKKTILEKLGLKKTKPEIIPTIKRDKENLSGKENK